MNKAIRAAYERAWRELRERAQRARDGSLTQRWLDDYAKAVHARAQELSSAVNDTVTGGMRTAAGAAAKATEDWLDLVGLRAGIDRSFTGTLSQASDEAMRAVVTGRAYLDGKRLSQRIWNAAGRLEGGINSVLEQGIAQKKSAYQIAKDLAAFVNPDAWEDYDWHKVYPDLPSWLSKGWTNVEKHAQRVARTSINHAYHIAMKESAARNPFATAIHWELSPSHWERQVKPFGADICDEYAAHDEGLGVGNWPIDGVPLPHPQCLCSQWAVTPDDLDACAQRLRRWLNGGEDASMDAAFAQWRQELQAGENDAIIELTRDDAAQRRAAAMESIAAREDVQGMSTTERQRYFNRLIHASTDELERLAQQRAVYLTDEQFGAKVGKHAQDWGLNPGLEADREKMRAIITEIVETSTDIRLVEWRGQQYRVVAFVAGEDVVLTKQTGDLITVMKGGAHNLRVERGEPFHGWI